VNALMSKPVYLIDASIYIFQSYFSPHYEVWSEDGSDLSAFFGFAQFMLRFLRQTQPEYLAVAFDESLFCGFRHGLYPGYKSNRVLPDEALARQLEACARLMPLLGVVGFGSKVYEADDIIGTLASGVRDQTVCIVSRDKDLAQLLKHEEDHLWDFAASMRRYRADILRQYGIRPEQFPDYLGLVGDAVDSIPGVPGIGAVAARCLLQHFQSIPLLYENLDEVRNLSYRGATKGADILRAYQQEAYLSRQLATIVQNVNDPQERFVGLDKDGMRWAAPQVDGVADLLADLGLDLVARERYLLLLQSLQPDSLRHQRQERA
jgi:5'-3' exonuclease